jgi:predicted transcriptional regulator
MLFELSSEQRFEILRKLGSEAMNATHLSKELDISKQESSRHLSRLDTAGLTWKDAQGRHHLTAFGGLILKQLDGLDFVIEHRGYFTPHSALQLPNEFILRLGDLNKATVVDKLPVAIYKTKKTIREAEKCICLITDHYYLEVLSLCREAFDRGVRIEVIEPKDWLIPPELKEAYPPDYELVSGEARASGLLEERVAEKLDIYLCMSEKEVATVAFPCLDGKFDYLGFAATNGRAHKWCLDLFHHFWSCSLPRSQVIEELYGWARERPAVIQILEKMVRDQEIEYNKALIPKLESMGLIKRGSLTRLGDIVYRRLQQRHPQISRKTRRQQ